MALFVNVSPDIRRAPAVPRRCFTRPAQVVTPARLPRHANLADGSAAVWACTRHTADAPDGQANANAAVGNANKTPDASASTAGDAAASTALTKRASGTLLGRVVVELLALVVGVSLLVFVAVWKCLNILWLYAWRAVLWLASVRRLGRWACGRAVAVGRAMMLSPGRLGVVLSAVWSNTLVGLQFAAQKTGELFAPVRAAVRRQRGGHVTVRSASVQEDEQLVSKKELDDVQREIARMRDILEQGGVQPPAATDAAQGDRAEAVAVAPKDPVHSKQEARDKVVDKIDSESVQTPSNSIAKANRRLVLLRHAKSAWDRSGNADDHSRGLSPVGIREAELVGAELRRRGWMFDSILCSNARRTLQTLELLTPSVTEEHDDSQSVVTESLYFAVSGDEMAKSIMNEAPEGSLRTGSTTLVLAHSPGCEELVEGLTGVKPEMGTACAALLELSPNTDPEERRSVPDEGDFQLGFGLKEWHLVGVVRPADLA